MLKLHQSVLRDIIPKTSPFSNLRLLWTTSQNTNKQRDVKIICCTQKKRQKARQKQKKSSESFCFLNFTFFFIIRTTLCGIYYHSSIDSRLAIFNNSYDSFLCVRNETFFVPKAIFNGHVPGVCHAGCPLSMISRGAIESWPMFSLHECTIIRFIPQFSICFCLVFVESQ